jgi:tetratricopeptide (TPR) repeat protein
MLQSPLRYRVEHTLGSQTAQTIRVKFKSSHFIKTMHPFRMVVLLWAILGFQSQLAALEPKQIFEIMAPSTVIIEDLDSRGSGLVISEKGLILTNHHVVAANLGLKVRAQVKFDDKTVLTEIADVKLVKIHPTYDLALLEVTPPEGGVLVAARIDALEAPLVTGIKCFAVGSPGGPRGQLLEFSITEGLVSAAAREVDGLSYIQISAQINPGNSGGAVCDEQGRVIGLATWKLSNTDGIGFAIPTQKLSLNDFVEPKAKKPDLELAKKAEQAARNYLDLADNAMEPAREALLRLGADCYRIAVQAVPDNSSPYNNLAVVYQRLGQLPIARKYAEAALKIAPADPAVCHLAGSLRSQSDPKNPQVVDECIETWIRGLATNGDKLARALCAEDIGLEWFKRENWFAATYMLRWAEMLTFEAVGIVDPNKRGGIWIKIRSMVPADQFIPLRNKKKDFSIAEYQSVLAGKLPTIGETSPPVVADPITTLPNLPNTPRREPPAPKGPITSADPSKLPVVASVPANGLDRPLPAVPSRAILANSGWNVVMAFPSLAKLGVFNLATARFDGYIDCDDSNPLLASGGRMLAVYLQSSRTLEVYDLGTRQKIASEKDSLPGPIAFIGMGAENPSRLFALWHLKYPNGANGVAPIFLNLPDLRPTPLAVEKVNGRDPLAMNDIGLSERLEGSMDQAGNLCAFFWSQGSGGLGLFELREGDTVGFRRVDVNPGFPSYSYGSEYLVTKRKIWNLSEALSPNVRYADWRDNNSRTPVSGYPAYVQRFREKFGGGFHILSFQNSIPLSEIVLPGDRAGKLSLMTDNDTGAFTLAAYGPDRIAHITHAEKRITLFPLGLREGNSLAKPGQHFERKLAITEGSAVSLESAPKGMTYDAKNGALVWDVPGEEPVGLSVQVIMLVTTPTGNAEYVVEQIPVL